MGNRRASRRAHVRCGTFGISLDDLAIRTDHIERARHESGLSDEFTNYVPVHGFRAASAGAPAHDLLLAL